ncbi:MAG: SpoVA/SpoVAEb family sporulation membrane protein [Clostridia bacterium]|nr:SpoVA/SpoVAEb family sporulation membrane protein [Clostridia bacterium]MBR3553114.1 SpoVA/SpoVAEb family sporulation membrane protein [Clostridia bacterium]
MSVSKDEYARMMQRAAPQSPLWLDCLKAFSVGGAICCLAEGLLLTLTHCGMGYDHAKALTMITLIVLTAALTGLGVFDRIAKHAGAGTAVPITGFANAMVAPTLESKAEGFIRGAGAQMFSIAGPVIAYGCSTAAVYGLIYYCLQRWGKA